MLSSPFAYWKENVMDIGATQPLLGSGSGSARESQRAAEAQQKALSAQAVAGSEAITTKQVEAAAASIQEFVQTVQRSINFAVDNGSGHVVVRVTDAGSGAVIRQIPSEEALRLAENLSDVRSLLFKTEA
jgi:flagellar protein FlaG